MLGKLLLNAYLWSAFLLVTGVGLILLPFILISQVVFLGYTVSSGLRRAIRFYGWVLVCVVPFLEPVSIEYSGSELPPVSIFVANHNSAIDPYLFGALSVENGFVTSWPFKIPVYNFFMRLAGYANTEEGWHTVLEKCSCLLDIGSSVTIWPEGHRSRNGKLGRFRNGAFTLAVETGHPVVPVCILGSGNVLPPGRKLFNKGEIKLIVMEPCYPDKTIAKEDSVRELRGRVKNEMERMLDSKGHFRTDPVGSVELC